MVSMKNIIERKIKEGISPDYLEVVNDSHNHKGHSGDDGTGESHFIIKIKSSKFDGVNKISSHRMLNLVLEDELKIIHSISFLIEK